MNARLRTPIERIRELLEEMEKLAGGTLSVSVGDTEIGVFPQVEGLNGLIEASRHQINVIEYEVENV